jgi:hypothetical protein
MKCSRCHESATIKQGNQALCDKHYRFGQMRQSARRKNKTVPPHEALSAMSGANLICPDCGIQMNWRSKEGLHSVVSLQHYRDGSMALVCRSCNTRHAHVIGDSYRQMPKDHKYCPSCKQTLTMSEFTKDKNRSGVAQRKSFCRTCSNSKTKLWKERNRDAYNEYQRLYRAKRKSQGNPIAGGS